jgi:hypothetical protein
MVDSTQDSLLGTIIEGRYRIDEKLGAGGMGAVYRATRLMIGDEVAVKILHAEQSDPNATQRFRREAQAAARLKHPNAVDIYDFGVTNDGLQYLVMEFVEGDSLRKLIKENGPFPCSTAAPILTQVCAALEEAHRHNIIHRDIKPDNIIINSLEAGLRVKVLDFGIAKLRDDAASSLTQTGNVLGTPHYMSPEQCLGEELDSRSDIYSLGVVLYEMLSGRVPFNSPVSTAVVVQHVNQTPPSLRTLNPSIPPAVETVVLGALEKKREARPQSATELSRYFEVAVRDGHTATISPDLFASTGSAGKLPSSMPTTTLLELAPKSSELTRQVPSRKKIKVALIAGVAALLIFGGIALYASRRRASQALNSTGAVSNNAVVTSSAAVITFNRNFAGSIGGKFKIVMKLQRSGKDLSGTYFYDPTNDTMFHGNFTKEPERWADKDIGSSRMDVKIKGTIDEQQNFSIDEFDQKGGTAGTFKGRFISDSELEGQWSKPNGKNVMTFSVKDEGSTSSGGDYLITPKIFVKKSGAVKSHMNYPQLDALSDQKIQSDFNDRVRALVSKDANSSTDVEGETHDGGFSIDYRSPDLISAVFWVDMDWTGSAHPMHYNLSFNYDLKHGRALELRDLFSPGSSYLAVVSRLCAKDIAEQKRKNGFNDIYEDGVAAASESLKKKATFYPTKEGLIFIFDPYEVGSYAEGFYVASIPYSQLTNIINPQGPLAPFLG